LKKIIYEGQQFAESKSHDKDLISPQHQENYFQDTVTNYKKIQATDISTWYLYIDEPNINKHIALTKKVWGNNSSIVVQMLS
jgi:hypothetical protein